ncbi:hypothetical protein IAD21_02198 [Abditibacteriota bacterium]|nr:hypothetical protein IAD21_02198 [Abditibacteriota bacterium]
MSQNAPQSSDGQSASTYTLDSTYQGLRSQIFDAYIQNPGKSGVWGVLMETGYPGAVATLVALADSTASLYFSNGGGLLGSGFQEGPGKAALSLVEHAPPFIVACRPVQTYPLPAQGHTRFYLLAEGQVFSTEAPEADLGYNRQPLSPLFHLAQNLIAEMRTLKPNWS